MRLRTGLLSEYKSSVQRLYGTNINKSLIFTLSLHWREFQFSDFCSDKRGPDGRDIQARLTDGLVQQRHVGGFLYFLYVALGSVCKTFALSQQILWPSSCACWANCDLYKNKKMGNVQKYNICINVPSSQKYLILETNPVSETQCIQKYS
jgi:hypothetical protein